MITLLIHSTEFRPGRLPDPEEPGDTGRPDTWYVRFEWADDAGTRSSDVVLEGLPESASSQEIYDAVMATIS
ncbi:hypothetical protein [Pannonibacter sp. SL95]|uniref:hypothetical protein n=1 Tax=Pannonibacter sp. SL95 TaxID=2995153 RepID=UPI002276C54A|nr:hypothetical protein [Pannonibacter sp. SL95]MCY1705465.1 hypothetical protein [Pannonibacter sp. SL95]